MTTTDHAGPVDYDIDEICRRYAPIYTGALADVLDEMGFRRQVLPPDIQALVPDHKVAGRALTVEGRRAEKPDRDDCFIPILRMLGDLQHGDVIVSQPHDDGCAHLGELCCESAKYRGARGAVVAGGVRDSDYILRLGFPVFCRYKTPLDVLGRWTLVSHGQPITVGDVTVRRGDFVVGDRDGVVIIPQEITLDVLRRAEQVIGTENLIRKAILEGVHPVEAYRRYGMF